MIGTVRARRAVILTVMALALAAAVAVAVVPALRRHAFAGGWGVWGCAAVCVAGGLVYLLSARRQS